MTGQELIDWIKENHAEGMQVVVQYRDLELGGIYPGVDEDLEPEAKDVGGKKVVML